MARGTDGNGITAWQSLRSQGYMAIASLLVIAGVAGVLKSKKDCSCERRNANEGIKTEQQIDRKYDSGWYWTTDENGRRVQERVRGRGTQKTGEDSYRQKGCQQGGNPQQFYHPDDYEY